MGCVDSGVLPSGLWVWVGGFVFLLFFFFFWLDAGVDLVAQWEARGVDLERDGGCVGCVGSMREITVLNK